MRVTAAPPNNKSSELSDEEREKNYARWRSWHSRNRSAYNTRRKLEAREKAVLRRQQQALAASAPVHKSSSFKGSSAVAMAFPNRDADIVNSLFWTRGYQPELVCPRETGWKQAAKRILFEAMMSLPH